MPYKKFRSGNGWKVWKLDEEGNKVGEPLSNKPMPMERADAQVRALYANEKKPKKELEDNSTLELEVELETKEEKMYIGEEASYSPFGGACSWDEMDAHEEAMEMSEKMGDMNYKFRVMADNILHNPMMEDKAQALADLAKGYAERITTQEMEDDKSLLKQIAGDNQPSKPDTPKEEPESTSTPGEDSLKQDTQSLYIWKEGETYKWLAAYSNNRRDNDNPPEIISSESHKEFDQALHAKEWPMPELWVWHIPLAVGQTTYHVYDESTGFPLAGGVFNKGFEWVAEGLQEAGWNGVSHGMPSEWIQRSKDDSTIITRHRTKEISILPQWAAANKLAFNIISKESKMADEEKGLPQVKQDELLTAFGDKAKVFLEAVENTSKEADEAGIEKKEAELTPDSPIVKALKDIVDSLSSLETRLKALEEKPTEKEEPFDLVAFLQGKSAIGKAETKVDGRSTLAKDKPEEAEQPSVTQAVGGIRISLADQFIGANQAYYAEKGGK